ncbi:MAG: hypothetical protein ABIU05_05150 [Nitrospirales bacterium]
MKLTHIQKRLTTLEGRTKTTVPRRDAQSAHQLRVLASDQTAKRLYNAALIEMGRLECLHQRFQPCIDAAPAVGAAWAAVALRMKTLMNNSDNVVAGE